MLKSVHPRRRAVLAVITAVVPVAALVTVISVPTTAMAAVPAPPAGWTTVFSDDFNGAAGTGVNTANWLYDTGTSYPGGAGNWGTGEVESETTSTTNVYQDGQGHLVIKPVLSNGAWTSGRIETQNTSFEAPAGGEMEMTASVEQPNPGSGLGYWPAFWAMGAAARGVGATNWPSIGELDIMEDVNALSEVSHTSGAARDNEVPGGPVFAPPRTGPEQGGATRFPTLLSHPSSQVQASSRASGEVHGSARMRNSRRPPQAVCTALGRSGTDTRR